MFFKADFGATTSEQNAPRYILQKYEISMHDLISVYFNSTCSVIKVNLAGQGHILKPKL